MARTITVHVKQYGVNDVVEQWPVDALYENDELHLASDELFIWRFHSRKNGMTYKSVSRQAWELHDALMIFKNTIDDMLIDYCDDSFKRCIYFRNAYIKVRDEIFNTKFSLAEIYNENLRKYGLLMAGAQELLRELTVIHSALSGHNVQGYSDEHDTLIKLVTCELACIQKTLNAYTVTEQVVQRLKAKAELTRRMGIFEYTKLMNQKNKLEGECDQSARAMQTLKATFNYEFNR